MASQGTVVLLHTKKHAGDFPGVDLCPFCVVSVLVGVCFMSKYLHRKL